MPTTIQPAYPTPQHAAASRAVLAFFQEREGVEAVLLVNSCARGKATRDSCLDIVVLCRPAGTDIKTLEALWYAHCTSAPVFAELERAGKYAEVHLDILTGEYAPSHREWTGGPDDFELQIGNHLVYSHTLWQGEDYLGELKARWLPYYPDELRRERLALARLYCLNNLHHIPLYVERDLYFQSFDRLYNAFKEFLQALFIHRRLYPIAYDKWIHEQVAEILGLPELYAQIPPLFEIERFESRALIDKAQVLEELLETYAPEA